jgi:UDP-N-acetylmuramate--alanine ligase
MTQAGVGFEQGLAGRRFQMVGIGGSGMSALARLLLDSGATVSGSDQHWGPELDELRHLGATVSAGHDAAHLSDEIDMVIASAAVPLDNPERLAAAQLGIPILKYSQMVGALMAMKEGVAVAGTHGKSTTTSMLAHVLHCGNLDPSFLIGANCPQLGGRAKLGRGRDFVVEACEFDRSFLNLIPKRAAILNIEADHLDYYQDLDEITTAFGEFSALLPDGGLLVVNGHDVRSEWAAESSDARVDTFGVDITADWSAENLSVDCGRYSFELVHQKLPVGRVSLSVAGKHQVLNALAAMALAADCGMDHQSMVAAIESFQGVDRRMTVRGCPAGVTVIDDYAHHPTELDVTLEAVRANYQPRRLVAVFQPHQFSRTYRLLAEFGSSFDSADEVLVTDIFAARDDESTIQLVTAQDVAATISSQGVKARASGSLEETIELLCNELQDGDVVAVMGAGDVDRVAYELVKRLEYQGAGRRAVG